MSATYPKPASPLPWNSKQGWDINSEINSPVAETRVYSDGLYIVHAANAFPHLVAALEAAADALDQAEMGIDPADRALRQYVIQTEKVVRAALAIARGQATP